MPAAQLLTCCFPKRRKGPTTIGWRRIVISLVVLAYAGFLFHKQLGSGAALSFHSGAPTNQESSQDQPLNDPSGMVTGDEAHDQKHSALGHYRNLAVLSFINILTGLLASFRPPGWRIAAWIAGSLPILFGLASVVLPAAESSLGLFWGLAAIAWGVVFIAMAELTRNKDLRNERTP